MIDTNQVRRSLTDRKGLIRHRETIRTLCDEIDRLRKQNALRECQDQRELANASLRPAAKPKPQGKTVRAEAFYAMDKEGYYRILGICGDSETQEYCRRDVCNDAAFDDGPVAFGKIAADLPIPEETEIVAEVENGRP